MRIFFYIGLILLALGFLAAASETAAYTMPGTVRTFFFPAHDLWYSLWPESLLIFELKVQRLLGAWAWDPVMVTLLKLPAWLILGGPGIALLLQFRPKRNQADREEIDEVENHYEFFDQLAKQARAENPPGEEHGPQDIMPEHPIGDDRATDAHHPDEYNLSADPYAEGRDKE